MNNNYCSQVCYYLVKQDLADTASIRESYACTARSSLYQYDTGGKRPFGPDIINII